MRYLAVMCALALVAALTAVGCGKSGGTDKAEEAAKPADQPAKMKGAVPMYGKAGAQKGGAPGATKQSGNG